MNFVEKFLTKHHLTHAPHKWFLALISSPIHAMEKYYEKKYHLNYGHARKLFIFDMMLVVAVIVLFGFTIFWFLYEPGVAENIKLSITKQVHGQTKQDNKIKSGEHLTYVIKYSNESESVLEDAKLSIELPRHFKVLNVKPEKFYTTQTKTFSLPKIQPGAKGKIEIEGFYLGKPGEHQRINAYLNYKQKERKEREQKITSIINVLQGSYVKAELKPERKEVLPNDQVSANLTISNDYHHDMNNIIIPLEGIEVASSSMGTISEKRWKIPNLETNQTATAKVKINISAEPDQQEFKFSMTPQIRHKDELIPQKELTQDFDVLAPNLSFSASWTGDQKLQPGDTAKLNLNFKNSGEVSLNDLIITIPTQGFISETRFERGQTANIQDEKIILTDQLNAKLTSLDPNQEKNINLEVPLVGFISQGEKIRLNLKPKLQAKVGKLDQELTRTTETNPLRIGTSIDFTPAARYFTPGGDQLGRGPLPPIVGESTKYWVFVNFVNTTNEIQDLRFSANLAGPAKWTGKTSVSHGKDLNYNSNSNSISWSYNSIPAHSKVGLYMQLKFTPISEHIGTTPALLRNIQLQAKDSFTGKEIIKTVKPIDISMPEDKRSQRKGVKVISSR